jgi:hypothetical protein
MRISISSIDSKRKTLTPRFEKKADLSDFIDIFHNFCGETVISFTTDLDLAIDLTLKKVTVRNSQNEEYLLLYCKEGGRSRGWMSFNRGKKQCSGYFWTSLIWISYYLNGS